MANSTTTKPIRLVRVTAYVFRFVRNVKAHVKKSNTQSAESPRSNSLSVEELNQSEIYWVKLNQKNLKSSLESRQLGKLDPLMDSEGILRVRGRVDKTIATYNTRHPVLLSQDHWTSKLIMLQAHKYGHSGVAAPVAKVRRRY